MLLFLSNIKKYQKEDDFKFIEDYVYEKIFFINQKHTNKIKDMLTELDIEYDIK